MQYNIIKIINIDKQIIYKKNIVLLSILKNNNVYIDYQCRSGYCGFCKIELIQGEILYLIKQPMAALSKSQEILPCCCKPCGNIIIKL